MMYNFKGDDFIEPLTPQEFCKKWVPRLVGVTPVQRRYRLICCRLLSLVTGKTLGTIQNWFLNPSSASYRHPEVIVCFYLKLLDFCWEVESLSPISNSLLAVKQYLLKKDINDE